MTDRCPIALFRAIRQHRVTAACVVIPHWKLRPGMRITQATLEHLDLLTPLFVKYREFYGALPFPDSSRAFLEKRLRRKE